MFPRSLFRKIRKRKELLAFHRAFVRPGELCFDIGANVGERTRAMRAVGARVVAVEPQKGCIEQLRSEFGGDNQVVLLQAAVGAEVGTATLHLCDEETECATLSDDFMRVYGQRSHLHYTHSVEVPLTTLDALIALHGLPAFVKVDVEGHESKVFAGLSQPLPAVAFEFNRLLLHDTVRSLERLAALGAAEVNFLRYEQMRLLLGEWMSIPSFLERIETLIPEEMLTGEIVVRKIR
jgi:FkbM family methyltransferase